MSQPSADSAQHHRDAAPQSVRVALVTISDTRTAETDESGQYLYDRLVAAGHQVVEREIVRDDAVEIRAAVVKLMRHAQVVLTTGGTGITGRDVTVPVIESLLTKPIPGFGELFRMLSYGQVRGAAMLTRAVGGVGRGALVFAMPGSLNAVKTAWENILEEELGHLVYELIRQGQLHQITPREELFTELPQAGIGAGAGLHPTPASVTHIPTSTVEPVLTGVRDQASAVESSPTAPPPSVSLAESGLPQHAVAAARHAAPVSLPDSTQGATAGVTRIVYSPEVPTVVQETPPIAAPTPAPAQDQPGLGRVDELPAPTMAPQPADPHRPGVGSEPLKPHDPADLTSLDTVLPHKEPEFAPSGIKLGRHSQQPSTQKHAPQTSAANQAHSQASPWDSPWDKKDDHK